MKKFVFLALAMGVFSASAFGEVRKFEVKGMHCKGCVEAVDGEVCGDQYSTCKVGLVAGKKNTGFVEIETKDGKALDVAALTENVKKAGDQYEVVEVTKTSKKK